MCRDEHEGSVAHIGGVAGVDPLQRAEGEIEDVDALLLLERAHVEVEVEETLLQSLRGEPGSKARVGMAGEDAALVRDVVIGLREVGDLVLVLRHRLSVG